MKEHILKTLPPFFAAVLDGTKTFEVRKDDRGFQVGDTLTLLEFDPSGTALISIGAKTPGAYTGRCEHRRITYKLDGGQFGIEPGYCVLGLGEVTP